MSAEHGESRHLGPTRPVALEPERVVPAATGWQLVMARVLVILLVLGCLMIALRVTDAGHDGPTSAASIEPPAGAAGPAAAGPTPDEPTGTIETPPVAALAGEPDARGADDAQADADEPPATPDEPTAVADGETPVPGAGPDDAAKPPTPPTPPAPAERPGANVRVARAQPREKYTVSSWRDFFGGLQSLVIRGAHGSGTASFEIVLRNDADVARSMYVVVYGRNDAISPPRREVWPAGVMHEDFTGSTGAMGSGMFKRTWHERPGGARGRHLQLPPGVTVTLKASLPMRPTSPHDAWRGQRLEPKGFIEYLIWILDDAGDLVYTKRYETAATSIE